MLASLLPIVYIQISPERLSIRNIKTGQSIDDVPEVAISTAPKPVILAVGAQARQAASTQPAQIVNPFAHPRSMVSDFTVAEQLIKHQLRQLNGRSWMSRSPQVIIHPLGSPAGGFTQVECRAFREMALGAGAAQVHVWTGRPLTDNELRTRQPTLNGGQWM